MSRLIDADKLRSDIIEKMSFLKSAEENLEIMGGCIDDATTVDAEPIRHGHWIYTDYCVWVCSECRENPTRGLGFVQAEEHLYEYCPRCGAKMDGGGMSGNEQRNS